MNLSAVDLNLLLAFEALYEERNVTRAARRLGLTQPAMSNALRRLRDLLRDPLFVRTGAAMAPTPRAEEIAPPVREGLARFRSALDPPSAFSPGTARDEFRIAITDYAEFRLLPGLFREVAAEAPGVRLFFRRADRIFVPPEADLRSGAFDFAIGAYPDPTAVDPSIHLAALAEEPNVCIARRGHPAMGGTLTFEAFTASAHAAIFYRAETQGMIDNILAGLGRKRDLRLTTPHFLTIPHLVASSDLIAIVPKGLALHFAPLLQLEVRNPPVDIPAFHTRLAWHDRHQSSPSHQWMREKILATAAALQQPTD